MKNVFILLFIILILSSAYGCGEPLPSKIKYVIDYNGLKLNTKLYSISENHGLFSILESDGKVERVTLRSLLDGSIVRSFRFDYKISHCIIHPKEKIIVVARSENDQKSIQEGKALIEFWRFDGSKDSRQIVISKKPEENGKPPLPNIERIQFSKDGKYIFISHSFTTTVEARPMSALSQIHNIGIDEKLQFGLSTNIKKYFVIHNKNQHISFFEKQSSSNEYDLITYDTKNNIISKIKKVKFGPIKISSDDTNIFIMPEYPRSQIVQLGLNSPKFNYIYNVEGVTAFSIMRQRLIASGIGGSIVYYNTKNHQKELSLKGCKQNNEGKTPSNCSISTPQKGHTSSILSMFSSSQYGLLISLSRNLIVWNQ